MARRHPFWTRWKGGPIVWDRGGRDMRTSKAAVLLAIGTHALRRAGLGAAGGRILQRQADPDRRRLDRRRRLRRVGAAACAAHVAPHPRQSEHHRREHAGRRHAGRDQPRVQRGAARRHRDRHAVALDAGGRGDEGRQRPLRSGEVQLDRQPRGQSPRRLHQQRVRDQKAGRSVPARADRRRHRPRAGHHGRARTCSRTCSA